MSSRQFTARRQLTAHQKITTSEYTAMYERKQKIYDAFMNIQKTIVSENYYESNDFPCEYFKETNIKNLMFLDTLRKEYDNPTFTACYSVMIQLQWKFISFYIELGKVFMTCDFHKFHERLVKITDDIMHDWDTIGVSF